MFVQPHWAVQYPNSAYVTGIRECIASQILSLRRVGKEETLENLIAAKSEPPAN